MDTSANLPDTARPTELAERDWLLSTLISVAMGTGAQVGITLQVGGLLVSGNIASGKSYFDGVSAALAGHTGNGSEIANGLGDALALLGAEIYGRENEDGSGPPLGYIHLADAHMFNCAGQSIPPALAQGTWWRGRLSAVDGFILGTLSLDSA